MSDRKDIVRGTKGSGKSALYRLVVRLSDFLLENQSLVLIKGVESTGDPVFAAFDDHFKQLDETGFQNFWRIYFLSLILSQFVADKETYGNRLRQASTEVDQFRRLAKKQGFPVLDRNWTLKSLIGWVLSRIPKLTLSTKTPEGIEASVEVEPKREPSITQSGVPIFVAELHDSLIAVLKASGMRLWIMLDRLDEVFPRRSRIETTALRSLLKTTLSFPTERLRIKVFLRDDIFDSITEAEGGFTALTHVLARTSDILSWSREQILQLIVNRIYVSDTLRRYFDVDKDRLQSDSKYREMAFYKIFPPTLRRGSNQSRTLDWIYNHCTDANGVVTPRDIIDLINLARGHQKDQYTAQPGDSTTVLGAAAILYGHRRMSEDKRTNYLRAEFRHFQSIIDRFEDGKAEHPEECIVRMLGAEWQRLARDLRSIGFLARNARTGFYGIPFLYRGGLGIRQGRCAGACK